MMTMAMNFTTIRFVSLFSPPLHESCLNNLHFIIHIFQHTGESSWELPQNAILEETNDTANEDQQFADHYEEENIEYDGAKYIEVFNSSNDYVRPQSIAENGPFDISLEPSLDQVPYSNQLGQSSVHSTRSTKSASYIPMKLLVKKSSHEGLLEKKTSFGNLGMMEKKHSAQSLGIKSGSALLLNRTPVVKDSLKPQTPQSQKTKLSGFALLKVGASVVRKQVDENGSTWLEYQAADNGPVFYAEEGAESAGQWSRPHVFDLDDFSSTSIVSVEPVNFDHLDEALISRPSSRRDLHSLVPGEGAAVGESLSKKSAGAYAPKAKVKVHCWWFHLYSIPLVLYHLYLPWVDIVCRSLTSNLQKSRRPKSASPCSDRSSTQCSSKPSLQRTTTSRIRSWTWS